MKQKAIIFSLNLKRLLKSKGWDLNDLHAHSGVSIPALRHYSAGYREPKPEFRKILAQTFDVDENEFFRTNFEPAAEKKEMINIVMTKEDHEAALIGAFQKTMPKPMTFDEMLHAMTTDPAAKAVIRKVLALSKNQSNQLNFALDNVDLEVIFALAEQYDSQESSIRTQLGLDLKPKKSLKESTQKKTTS